MPLFRLADKLVMFCHVPRTAGTYIEGAMLPYFFGLRNDDYTDKPDELPCSPQHFHRPLLRYCFPHQTFDFSFMTIRHPLDRLFSVYRYRKLLNCENSLALDFDGWVRFYMKRVQDFPFVFDNHLRPAEQFLLPGITVYKLEDGMEKIFSDLQAITGLVLKTDHLKDADRNKTTPEQAELSGAALSMVADFYAEDFKLFQYRLEDAQMLQ